MRHKICPACGARNAEGALWCGQCYTNFGDHDEAVPSEVPASDGELPLQPAVPVTPSGAVWTCSVCGTEHSIEVAVCPVCGTSMFAPYLEPEPVDPKRALVRGLLLPGLGHGAVGQGPLGAAIGLLVVVTALFGVLLLASGIPGAGWGLVLGAVGVWAVAALDAFRFARQETSEVLLRPRVVTVLAGAVVTVLIAVSLGVQGKVQP